MLLIEYEVEDDVHGEDEAYVRSMKGRARRAMRSGGRAGMWRGRMRAEGEERRGEEAKVNLDMFDIVLRRRCVL